MERVAAPVEIWERRHGAACAPLGGYVEAPEPAAGRPASRTRVPWAELLRKVLDVDVLECPKCSGRLEVVATGGETWVRRDRREVSRSLGALDESQKGI